MYQDYFQFTAMPFSIAPDPRFLYMSSRHREALAHLLFGMQGEGGLVLLTGEVGTGKTTLCRCVLEQIDAQSDVAFILNPKMNAEELLAAICDEFHIEVPVVAPSVKVLVDAINARLLRANAEGRRAVLIIDEAQNLHPDVLEQLRLLTNLETNTRKLLQIILIGQPELQDMLRRPELRQVAQRVVARYHLAHLTRQEVGEYVTHRLRVAGARIPLIPHTVIGPLYRLTGGVPRLINLVCDRTLLGVYTQGKMQVTRKILRRAAGEVFGVSAPRLFWRRVGWPLKLTLAVCAGVAAGAGYILVAKPLSAAPTAESAAAAMVRANPLTAPFAMESSAALAASTRPASGDAQSALEDLSWPDAAGPRARSEEMAFQHLFKLYGVAYERSDMGPACKAAQGLHLHCLSGRGGLSDLIRINQPAVLLMDGDGKGRHYYAVITSIDEKTARFSVGGVPRRVSLGAIAPLWSGNFVTLWNAPPGGQITLGPGSRGPAVVWLRQGLARLRGGEAEGPPVYDDELTGRVKAFQLAEGIVPDGVAGALTLIRLNMRLDKSSPRLIPAAGG